jgi:hypothetical protein
MRHFLAPRTSNNATSCSFRSHAMHNQPTTSVQLSHDALMTIDIVSSGATSRCASFDTTPQPAGTPTGSPITLVVHGCDRSDSESLGSHP